MTKPTPAPGFAATLAKTDADIKKVAGQLDQITKLHKLAPTPPDALAKTQSAVLALSPGDLHDFLAWMRRFDPL